MAQLLKHYWVDRDRSNVFAVSPEQFSRPLFGTVPPNIEGLEIVHRLTDNNGIEFCLSTCPDETVIEEVEGLSIITQLEWDQEIATYDASQELKRWDVVRKYRDSILSQSDWAVIKAKETGEYLSADFKDWRQSLRDLPSSSTFPIQLPAVPSQGNEGVSIDSQLYDQYVAELRSIPMINDPLPEPEPTQTRGPRG